MNTSCKMNVDSPPPRPTRSYYNRQKMTGRQVPVFTDRQSRLLSPILSHTRSYVLNTSTFFTTTAMTIVHPSNALKTVVIVCHSYLQYVHYL